MRHVFDVSEIGWSVIGSDPGFVIAENHVHDPVETVLNGPMASYDRSQQVRQRDQRGDVKPRVLLDHTSRFARAFDHRDGIQARPVMAFS